MDEPRKHPLIAGLRERRERHRERSRLYRLAFTAAGITVTLAGVAMLVTPGPALVVIPIGLAMLALEFAWAEALLERAVERAEAARRTATDASFAQKALGILATLCAAAAAVAAAVFWDVPVLPV